MPLFLEERDESNVKIINDKKNNTAVKIERANFSWDNEQPILKSFFFISKKYFLLLINFFLKILISVLKRESLLQLVSLIETIFFFFYF